MHDRDVEEIELDIGMRNITLICHSPVWEGSDIYEVCSDILREFMERSELCYSLVIDPRTLELRLGISSLVIKPTPQLDIVWSSEKRVLVLSTLLIENREVLIIREVGRDLPRPVKARIVNEFLWKLNPHLPTLGIFPPVGTVRSVNWEEIGNILNIDVRNVLVFEIVGDDGIVLPSSSVEHLWEIYHPIARTIEQALYHYWIAVPHVDLGSGEIRPIAVLVPITEGEVPAILCVHESNRWRIHVPSSFPRQFEPDISRIVKSLESC